MTERPDDVHSESAIQRVLQARFVVRWVRVVRDLRMVLLHLPLHGGAWR